MSNYSFKPIVRVAFSCIFPYRRHTVDTDSLSCVEHSLSLWAKCFVLSIIRFENVTKWNVRKQKSSCPSSAILCVFVTFLWLCVGGLEPHCFFPLLDQSRSGYCISHSIEDWSAAVHWGVQSRLRHCSLSLHFSVSPLSVSVRLYLSFSHSPA